MSNVPIKDLLTRKFSKEIENSWHLPSFFYGGASSRLESLPDNVIPFISGGDHTKNPSGLHNRYTLLINLQEQCHLCVDSNVFRLSPGYGILIFPFQLHYFKISKNLQNHYRVIITFEMKNPNDSSLLPLRDQVFELNRKDVQIIYEIHTFFQPSNSEYHSEIPSLLATFLSSRLNRIDKQIPHYSKLPHPSDHFKLILNFIYANYMRPISIKQIAEQVNLSPSQVRLIFKKMTNGLSLGKFIDNLRLLRSTEYLMHSEMNIHEIATFFGFSDQFVFSRAFKRRFLVSPLKYRQMNSLQQN